MLKLRLVWGRGNKMAEYSLEAEMEDITEIAIADLEKKLGRKLSENEIYNFKQEITAYLIVSREDPVAAQQMADILDPTGEKYTVPMLKFDEFKLKDYLGVK